MIVMNEILKTFAPAIIAALNVFGVLLVAMTSCYYIVASTGCSVGYILQAMF